MAQSSYNFELRTLIFLDCLQAQLAKAIPEKNIVQAPAPNDAMLIIEIAPAMEIHALLDLALKRTKVQLGALITERHYGQLFLHHADQGEIIEAGREILRTTNTDENNRAKIETLTNKIIRGIESDHANYFNLETKYNKVLPGESVFILETTPAAYLAIACNEALKAADIKLITIRSFGATSRLVMSGHEAEIDSGAGAALKIIDQLNTMRSHKNCNQFC